MHLPAQGKYLEVECPPVIFLVFNRPEQTRRVFERIRDARPRELFVVADGPREGHPTDRERCAAVRAIINEVDWDCDLTCDFSTSNLGCGKRVSSGISAAFERFEEAIILEDDCLPDPSFFNFCEQLLQKYREDPRVMNISGNNFQAGQWRGDGSYYFSKYMHCWGWATWRNAWKYFELSMTAWPQYQESEAFASMCPHLQEHSFWCRQFNNSYNNVIDTWDIPWQLTCWIQNGLTILPNVNLVDNIGFCSDATHTPDGGMRKLGPNGEIIQIYHPSEACQDEAADLFTFSNAFNSIPNTGKQSFLRSLIRRLVSSEK